MRTKKWDKKVKAWRVDDGNGNGRYIANEIDADAYIAADGQVSVSAPTSTLSDARWSELLITAGR